MAEFPDLGAHCCVKTCKQRDFLPFTCDGCKKKYCLDHRTRESHECIESNKDIVEALFCPLCNQSISIKRGEDRNDTLDLHIENGCKLTEAEERRKELKKKGKCSLDTCNKCELLPVICKKCNKQFCMKHRLEIDHHCNPNPTKNIISSIFPPSTPDDNEREQCVCTIC